MSIHSLPDQKSTSALLEEERLELALAFFGQSRGVVNNVKGLVRAPTCANCRKRYGLKDYRSWTARFGIGETIPDYQGTDALVSENVEVGAYMGPAGSPGCEVTRKTWDRKTYHAPSMTDPFCTKECAAQFGRRAYLDGYRRKPAPRRSP